MESKCHNALVDVRKIKIFVVGNVLINRQTENEAT